MKISIKKLKQIIEDIVDKEAAANKLYGIKRLPPQLRPPASAQDLAELEKHFQQQGLSLPPTYRAFLSVCNGIEGFNMDLNLLTAKEVMKPTELFLQSDFPNLAKFVIGSGNTSQFISFNSESKEKAGELEVVWVMENGVQFRYPNFEILLQRLLKELKKNSRRTCSKNG